MSRGLVLLLVLAGALSAWGQTGRRPLAWNYERALVPPVQAFGVVAVDGRGGVQQFQVVPSEPGACDWAPEVTEATFCGTVTCPPGGSITAYWVQAVSATSSSPPSEVVTCYTPPQSPTCACLDPSQAPAGTGLPPATAPVQTSTAKPALSTEVPPRPQQSAEGLNLQAIGPLPTVSQVPSIPESHGT